jgi:hypothetical protein
LLAGAELGQKSGKNVIHGLYEMGVETRLVPPLCPVVHKYGVPLSGSRLSIGDRDNTVPILACAVLNIPTAANPLVCALCAEARGEIPKREILR